MKKYYGQEGGKGEIDKILHEIIFPGKTDGFFIECGAYDGVDISTCKFFEEIGWKGINIEPSPDIFKKLEKNRPNSINLNLALSDSCEIKRFVYTNEAAAACGSLIKATDIFVQVCSATNSKILETTVETTTYAKIIEKFNCDVDLFVLDVEGHEMEVINGMIDCSMPKVICAEFGHVGLENLSNKFKNFEYSLIWKDDINAIYALI